MIRKLCIWTAILHLAFYSQAHYNGNSVKACGRAGHLYSVLVKRIVNGRCAMAHSWPWMAILQMWNSQQSKFVHWCDAVLVHERHVTTAAHCMFFGSQNLTHFRVRLGDHDRSVTEPSEQDFAVVRKVLHPNYNNFADNDLAVLELNRVVQLNRKVSLACLPEQGVEPAMSSTCFLTGWGTSSVTGPKPKILQEARLPLAPPLRCARAARFFNITNNMICAGFGPKSKVSGCIGDSGGPLNCYNKIKRGWIVEGSLTGGTGECGATYTVFARLNKFRDWIDCQVGNSPGCTVNV